MKIIKSFKKFNENYSDLEQVNYKGVKIVYCDDVKDMSPLHYMWVEYPKYKMMKNGRLQYAYELYTDNSGDKYFIYDGERDITVEQFQEIKKIIDKNEIKQLRNVDVYVNGSDKEEYQKWIEYNK